VSLFQAALLFEYILLYISIGYGEFHHGIAELAAIMRRGGQTNGIAL
jgi:hypothetical protein